MNNIASGVTHNFVVNKSSRATNTHSKDDIVKQLGAYCSGKNLTNLSHEDKNFIVMGIRELDKNYNTLFGKKTHTESAVVAWVLVFSHFKGYLPSNLAELNRFITSNFTDVGLNDSDSMNNDFAWGRNNNQNYFENACNHLNHCFYGREITNTNTRHDYAGFIDSFNLKTTLSFKTLQTNINRQFGTSIQIDCYNLNEITLKAGCEFDKTFSCDVNHSKFMRKLQTYFYSPNYASFHIKNQAGQYFYGGNSNEDWASCKFITFEGNKAEIHKFLQEFCQRELTAAHNPISAPTRVTNIQRPINTIKYKNVEFAYLSYPYGEELSAIQQEMGLGIINQFLGNPPSSCASIMGTITKITYYYKKGDEGKATQLIAVQFNNSKSMVFNYEQAQYNNGIVKEIFKVYGDRVEGFLTEGDMLTVSRGAFQTIRI